MLYKGFQAHPCSDVRTLNIVTKTSRFLAKETLLIMGCGLLDNVNVIMFISSDSIVLQQPAHMLTCHFKKVSPLSDFSYLFLLIQV